MGINLQELRKFVVNLLFQVVEDPNNKNFINENEAIKIENLIFDVCEQLSKEQALTVKDIYLNYGYQKIGEIIACPSKKTQIMNDLEEYIFDWESSVFEDYKQREYTDINKQIAGIKVKVGVFVCQKKECSSKECYYSQVQSRSMDEGFTTNVICTKCGNRFTFN